MTLAPRNASRGYLIGVGATVALSFTGILISYLSRTYSLPSLVLAFWRDFFVVIGLAAAFAALQSEAIPRREAGSEASSFSTA